MSTLKARASTKRALYNADPVYNLLNAAISANFQNRVCDEKGLTSVTVSNLTVLPLFASPLKINGQAFNIGSSSVVFSQNAVSAAGKCSQIAMTSLPYDASSQTSAAIDIVGGGSSVIGVSGVMLTGNVSISYPLSTRDAAVASRFLCGYRANYTRAWSYDNTVTASVSGNTLTCTSSHLTEFAAQDPGATLSPTSSTNSSAATASASFTTAAGTTDTSGAAAPPSSSGLSGGQIAGIVIGSVVGGLLIIGAIVGAVFYARKKSRENDGGLAVPMQTMN